MLGHDRLVAGLDLHGQEVMALQTLRQREQVLAAPVAVKAVGGPG